MIRLFTILILLSIVFFGGLASGGIAWGGSKRCMGATPQFQSWTPFYEVGSISLNWPTFSENCKAYYYPDTKQLIPNQSN